MKCLLLYNFTKLEIINNRIITQYKTNPQQKAEEKSFKDLAIILVIAKWLNITGTKKILNIKLYLTL